MVFYDYQDARDDHLRANVHCSKGNREFRVKVSHLLHTPM